MNSYKTISDSLDVFVRQIAKASVLVTQTELMSGKIGIAILLYQYGRYRNDPKITECADLLIDSVMPNFGKGFDNGLYGITWGIDYLINRGFVEADENIFDEIDAVLFREDDRSFILNDLDTETGKGLYAWNRLISSIPSTENKWRQYVEDCVYRLYNIFISKYTNYVLPVFPCKFLIRFFHVCQTVGEYGLLRPEIGVMYEELPEIVKISYKEEKSISEKYILATLLNEIPMFEGCISIGDAPQLMTLTDVNNFYLTQLILGRKISIPEVVNKTVSSITKDHQRINELLDQLNSDNAGLGNDVGGLAWAMMQWCMEQDNILAVSNQ